MSPTTLETVETELCIDAGFPEAPRSRHTSIYKRGKDLVTLVGNRKRNQLQRYLDKGLIRPSSPPFVAPVFFIKRKNGELRMVCDYRALKKINVPESSPIPLIDETIDQVAGAQVILQLELIWRYHHMRLKDEDCHKTAIRTRFRSFDWRFTRFMSGELTHQQRSLVFWQIYF